MSTVIIGAKTIEQLEDNIAAGKIQLTPDDLKLLDEISPATELLADLEQDKEPILITQHGLPSAYLVDVESYERMTILEGIARGEMAVAEGRIVSHADAKARMGRWLK